MKILFTCDIARGHEMFGSLSEISREPLQPTWKNSNHLKKKKTTRVLGNLRKVKIIRFTKYKKATATEDLEKLEPCLNNKKKWLGFVRAESRDEYVCLDGYTQTHTKSIINYQAGHILWSEILLPP